MDRLIRYFLIGVAAAVLLSTIACSGGKKPSLDGDKLREYAGDLINRALFKQAIDQYQRYLDEYDIDSREQANVNYIIANTYFDRLKDYENALAYYLKIKHLYPESSLIEDVNKRIIACLERLERSTDAKQALDETVQADQSQVAKKRPGEVLARIGSREITQGDLDFEIDQLPPSVREQFRSKEKKMEFLREFVASELLYDTAKRAEIDQNPEVIEGAFQAKKMLMVRKLLQDRIAGKIDITNDDIGLYYDAHKSDYSEKDKDGKVIREKSLSDVQQQVAQDLYRKKYQDAYQNLIERMMLAENVQIHEAKVQ
jgi:tetratricopeptide (TPR) repeat protein